MAKRKITFEEGGYYHLFNRGAGRRKIFFEHENYLFLLEKVRKYSNEFNIQIIAYCLLPNHYHFLVKQNSETSTQVFTQRLFNSYSKAVNKRFGRTGTLFEGPFKAIHIDKEAYLIHLCRYIHRNPLEAGLVKQVGTWPYSNLKEWLEQRNGTLFDRDFRKMFFDTPDEYMSFITSYRSPKNISK